MEIGLERIEFFCFHGLHESEKVFGNKFWVDLAFHIKDPSEELANIHQTVDYTLAYQLVKEIMDTPEELLENLCIRIIRRLKMEFRMIEHVKVRVSKLNPPIENTTASSYVEMQG